MDKYQRLGIAFESVAEIIDLDLQNLAETAEEDNRFAELYQLYSMLLTIINVTRSQISARFDEIEDNG